MTCHALVLVILTITSIILADVNALSPPLGAHELQRDIITDVAKIPAGQVVVPDFFQLLKHGKMKDVQVGNLVTKKYDTIAELKSVKPVHEVRGTIVAGPFSMTDAVRMAGQHVIRRIFGNRIMSLYAMPKTKTKKPVTEVAKPKVESGNRGPL